MANDMEKELKKLEGKIDEFTRASELSDAKTQKDVEYIRKEIGEIKKAIADGYVTHTEFEPIKKLVYGVVSLILVGVVGALLALVVKGNGM